jgi:glutamyl-tRNA synthetase
MQVRTRMAPSPTGEYHIGHIRTVLYDYALARQQKGKFIIRIEDTDQTRFVEGATERILDVIKDYGLDWDEGPRVGGPYEPYFQSERLDIYKKYALELVEKGHAYYCFCTSERLEKIRQDQRDQKLPVTKYDRFCLNLSKEEIAQKLESGIPYVIRQKMPTDEVVSFHDEVHGDVSVNTNDVDDQVLLKSDGFPTYQLAVVIDDHLMQITHILRGIDWIPSTPKHVLLYRAFGWDIPKHAHLPNIKELGGSKKLSKRFGAVMALEFLQEGYLPRALLNFLMFLGWNPGTEKEIYTLSEFIKDFSLERLQKTDLVAFDREKLAWYNGHYIRNTASGPLWHEIKSWARKFDISLTASNDDAHNVKVLDLVKERMKVLSEFNNLTHYFYNDPEVDLAKLVSYAGDENRSKEIIKSFVELFEKASDSDWVVKNIDEESHKMIAEKGYKPKEAFMTLRFVTTGESATPPIFDILGLLGKETTLRRLKK